MATELNLIDVLLQQDAATLLQQETEEYEVKSLTRKTGKKFVLTLQGLNTDMFMKIRNQCTAKNKKGKEELNESKFSAKILLEGIKKPDFHSMKLAEHFNVGTPEEIMTKLFNAGETNEIAKRINVLSGQVVDVDDDIDVDEEIKN
ncbi:phage tail assembly chaperone [Veillonella intestinalis]|uniref:phage tail assembly chaperone n=1 Tax=Veillonella intestinalis TaxID=2941341 RepID=UPI00203C89D3|nr:hypothetical protein [Veillonella intestinalis]